MLGVFDFGGCRPRWHWCPPVGGIGLVVGVDWCLVDGFGIDFFIDRGHFQRPGVVAELGYLGDLEMD